MAFKVKIISDTFKAQFTRKAADPMMKEVAQMIDMDAKKNIRNQVTPDGDLFKPLKLSTIEKKIRKGSQAPSRALIDKGIMLRSIRAKRLALGKYEIGVAERGNPSRGALSDYHHEGGGNLPARPFLGISAKRLEWIDARVGRWITSQLNKGLREAKKKTKIITSLGGGLF